PLPNLFFTPHFPNRGGRITPQTDLFNGTPEPLGIYEYALVTFPEYVLATKWRKIYILSANQESNMATGNRK
ncbi:MAG TPA: hypothetical protein VIJ25_11525, partial [Methylococcales bacterium]